ncbi:hypothetical protein GZ178_03480 [Dermatophilus congolensis]|uniref:hypothetical protein n=1 Tax=Dermatophilus congolensis TaxID=1863 RepID=UPI001AAED7D0|nr:hypothetical protein [Dermatophilus congolensis]MBO3183131.1 hypothetical protein [Dermatophilus congolensis]MBO3205648.1 hypothetical protein [Dermatophilus congolensis]
MAINVVLAIDARQDFGSDFEGALAKSESINHLQIGTSILDIAGSTTAWLATFRSLLFHIIPSILSESPPDAISGNIFSLLLIWTTVLALLQIGQAIRIRRVPMLELHQAEEHEQHMFEKLTKFRKHLSEREEPENTWKSPELSLAWRSIFSPLPFFLLITNAVWWHLEDEPRKYNFPLQVFLEVYLCLLGGVVVYLYATLGVKRIFNDGFFLKLLSRSLPLILPIFWGLFVYSTDKHVYSIVLSLMFLIPFIFGLLFFYSGRHKFKICRFRIFLLIFGKDAGKIFWENIYNQLLKQHEAAVLEVTERRKLINAHSRSRAKSDLSFKNLLRHGRKKGSGD